MVFLYFYIPLAFSESIEYFSAFHQDTNLYCQTSTCPYGFKVESLLTSAIYVNCTIPKSNALILDKSQIASVANYNPKGSYNAYSIQPIIVFDVYFISQWMDDFLIFQYNTHIYNMTYSTQNKPNQQIAFCGEKFYQVRTFFISLPQGEQFKNITFRISSSNLKIFIKNVHISYILCYPGCKNCTGRLINQCTSCLTTQINPIQGICRCPSGQAFNKFKCSAACQYYQSVRKEGSCSEGSQRTLNKLYLVEFTYSQLISWNVIFDSMHSSQIQNKKQEPYFGIFQYQEGASIIVNTTNFVYPLAVQVSIIFCNQTPQNSGIQFYFDNIYHSSVYFSGSTYVYDNLYSLIEAAQTINKCSSSKKIDVILNYYVNIQNFVFSAKGNFTNGQSGWYLVYSLMSSGYCPNFCIQCDKEQSCSQCQNTYKKISDGSCSLKCPIASVSINSSYCQLLEHQTKYSQYFIQLFEDFKIPNDIKNVFVLESQTVKDFLKGDDIYWSYISTNMVFGGKYVWANARFSQIYSNLKPHHSISLFFQAYFGYLFPSTSYLGYQINNGTEEKVQTNQSISKTFSHSIDELSIALQCYGDLNNAIDSYCAISNYYIIIHYCQPYCLICTDETNCLQMSTYDSSVIKLNQLDCQTNQFLNEFYHFCENCPIECSTCFNEFECYTCNSPYVLYVSKCLLVCQTNQYRDSQSQTCLSCDQKCKQCRNSTTNCINCEINYFRYLYYGQCLCYDGYYDSPNFLQCQVCHTSCTKCIGPTSYQCLECISIQKMNLNQNTCQCDSGYFFNPQTIECQQCNQKCLNCFSDSENSCLSCDISLNRIIKGFQCQCSQGYFEVDNNCVTCSINEDLNQYQCYKQCGDNSVIWFNSLCPLINCNLGFDNLNNQCFPKCGDGLVKGNEECDDQNNIPFDGCYNCKFHCPQECLTCDSLTTLPCQSICGDGLISGNEECDDQNINKFDGCYNCKLECQIQCTNCLRGQCYECQTYGWIYDAGTKQCIENCGDYIVIGKEQCDDGYNFDSNDSCFQCQRVCREDCKTCSSDGKTCLECKLVGFKPKQYFCVNICGDGYLAIDPYGRNNEECDDFNNTDNDGCSSTCTFQCQPSAICNNCVSNICQQCADHYYLNQQKNKCIETCNDNFIIGNEKCEDMNNQMLDGCYNCQLSCQQSCQTCTIKGCTQCIGGFQLINLKCVPICGDGKKVSGEECDDGNLIPFDGCHGCQFSCSQFCQLCNMGVCFKFQQRLQFQNTKQQFVNIEQKYVSAIGKFVPFCLISILGFCQKCSNDFDIKQINFFRICKFDNIQSFDQAPQLDHINEQYDEISVQKEQICQNYIGNQCLVCKQSYNFNPITQLCEAFCGDGQIGIQEECDDLQNDSCLDCILQCQVYCNKCIIGKCFSCQEGYFFNQVGQYCSKQPDCSQSGFYYDGINNLCYDICGDGIVSPNEECDDEQDKTCQNCKYLCENGCFTCQFGQCIDLKCEYGYYLDPIQNYCFNVCGDGLIAVNDEECDIGNNSISQNCIDCKLLCDQNCQQCLFNNFCVVCEQNFYLNNGQCLNQYEKDCLENDNCISYCGNGALDNSEQCDDGNQNDFDGCDSDCTPSQYSLCKNQECQLINPPSPSLMFLDEKMNRQIVKLIYDQQVQLNSAYNFKNYLSSLQAKIENANLNFIFDYDKDQRNLDVVVNFLYESEIKDPILTINFENIYIVTNVYGIPLSIDIVHIKLPTPCILTQNQIELTQSLIGVGDSQIQIFLGLMIIFSLTGQFSIVQNYLDIMQQFYYFKYFNTKLPYNLETYFEIFKTIQITNLYDLIGFNPSSNDQLQTVNLDFCSSEIVFENDDRNANFLINFFLISGIFLTAIFSLIFFNFFFKLIMQRIQKTKIEQLTYSKQLILHKIIKYALNYQKINIYKLILNILISILYELTISIFLSIKYQKIQNIQSTVSLILSFTSLYSSILLFVFINQDRRKYIQNQLFDNVFIYSCAYRMIFSLVLIFCFNNIIIQIISCNLNEIAFILYMAQKLFPDQIEKIKIYMIHITFFFVQIFLLLNEMYSRTPEMKITFGWICIALICFSTFSLLLIDIYFLVKPLILKIAKLISGKTQIQKDEIFESIQINYQRQNY